MVAADLRAAILGKTNRNDVVIPLLARFSGGAACLLLVLDHFRDEGL